MSWFSRLKQGLDRPRKSLTGQATGGEWEVDWDDLEFALSGADVGAGIAAEVVEEAKKDRERGTTSREALQAARMDQLDPDRRRQTLRRVGFTLDVARSEVELKGKVVMVVGVNGAGKTTTIAKRGQYYQGYGRKVMFAAGDTFRAAATAQLEVWGERLGIPTISGPDGGDPGSVALARSAERRGG